MTSNERAERWRRIAYITRQAERMERNADKAGAAWHEDAHSSAQSAISRDQAELIEHLDRLLSESGLRKKGSRQ